MPPSTRNHPATAPTLNAGIEALIVAKDNPKLAPAKTILESILRILGIARVRVSLLFLFSLSFPEDMLRMGW